MQYLMIKQNQHRISQLYKKQFGFNTSRHYQKTQFKTPDISKNRIIWTFWEKSS
jgi:hypothetical protein